MAQLNRINLVGVSQRFVEVTYMYHERLASDDGAAPRSEEGNKGGRPTRRLLLHNVRSLTCTL